MIIYLTKKTAERYHIDRKEIPERQNEEAGDRLPEWGAKIFYFSGHKGIQLVNFASEFTLFLIDIHQDQLADIPDIIAFCMWNLYAGDMEMLRALAVMFESSPDLCFGKLTDKSAISTLNMTQDVFLDNGGSRRKEGISRSGRSIQENGSGEISRAFFSVKNSEKIV